MAAAASSSCLCLENTANGSHCIRWRSAQRHGTTWWRVIRSSHGLIGGVGANCINRFSVALKPSIANASAKISRGRHRTPMPVVTAVVDEAVSSRIQVGSPVHFRPRDGRELPGTVIRLSAASVLPANLAIPSSALPPGSYHITVAVPELGQGCLIGRTGRMFFDNGSAGRPSLFASRRRNRDG
jgi:hypothetical protein